MHLEGVSLINMSQQPQHECNPSAYPLAIETSHATPRASTFGGFGAGATGSAGAGGATSGSSCGRQRRRHPSWSATIHPTALRPPEDGETKTDAAVGSRLLVPSILTNQKPSE